MYKASLFKIRGAVSAGIALLTFSIYINTLYGEFLPTWDDGTYVTENLLIRDINLKNSYEIFTATFDGSYQPVTIFSLATDYRLWGLDPYGYHLTNTLLHTLNSLLVYLLLLIFLKKSNAASKGAIEMMAAFGAFIFASHPINVESVAWITERKNALSMTFFLLSFISYLNYKETLRRWLYDISLAFFIFALFSKSAVITLPVLITVYDLFFLWNRPNGLRPLLLDKIPFFFLSAAIAGMTILAHAAGGYIHPHPLETPSYTFFTMLKVSIVYIKNVLFPFNLAAVYDLLIPTSLMAPTVLLSGSMILIMCALTVYLSKKDKILSYGIVLFFIPFLPVSNIVKIAIYMADRYLYIPMIGFSLLQCVLLYRVITLVYPKVNIHKSIAYAYILIACFIVYEYSLLTIKRGGVWKNGLALWEDTTLKSPRNIHAHYFLAINHTENGNYREALAHITRAMELNPDDNSLLYQRAVIFIKTGDYKRGKRDLERVQKRDTNFAMVYYGFGSLYTLQGELEEADSSWKKFLEVYKPSLYLDDSLIKIAKAQIKKYSEDKRKRLNP